MDLPSGYDEEGADPFAEQAARLRLEGGDEEEEDEESDEELEDDERAANGRQFERGAQDEEEEEEPIEEYPLPPLPEPRPPETVNGIAIDNIYEAILALKREVDDGDPEKQAKITSSLMQERDLVVALFRVLHESKLLRTADDQSVPLPSCPQPNLPPGTHSWIVPNAANSK